MTDLYNKIEKAVVNVGIGKLRGQANFEEKFLPEIKKEIAEITGQQPCWTASRKSIAGFKVRQGETVGLVVTLRRGRLEDFLKRLVTVVFPRVKDFRGLDLHNVDERGNLNIGFKEQFVFPEINIEKSRVNFGIQVTVVPVAKKRDQAIDLYRQIGVPLRK